MQPATVRFSDQRVVFDRVTRAPFLLRITGQFVGYGVDPHEVPTMQQWLAQAAFHALDRFQQPLADLPKHQQFWSAEVTNLVNPVFNQHFQAQGTAQILTVEVLPATSHGSIAPGAAPAQQPPPSGGPVSFAPSKITVPVAQPSVPAPVAVAPPAPAPPPPPPPVEEPISSQMVDLDPWELELRPIVDPPTSVSVKLTVLVAYKGTAISAPKLAAAQKLAAECVADAISKECEQGRSVLDLLLFASMLSTAANEGFERSVTERARARGAIAVRDIRLAQEDAERLRDLYGQIAAARGG